MELQTEKRREKTKRASKGNRSELGVGIGVHGKNIFPLLRWFWATTLRSVWDLLLRMLGRKVGRLTPGVLLTATDEYRDHIFLTHTSLAHRASSMLRV